jgi:hypothetical protein
MTDHERFENWFAIELEKGSLYLADKEDCFWLWQAATKAERERCAKICENNTASWADVEWNIALAVDSAVSDCVKKIRGE